MSDGLNRCKCGFVMPSPMHYPCKSGGTLKETYAPTAARSAFKDFGGSMTDFERGLEAARFAAAAEQLDWVHSDQAWAACANICARIGKIRTPVQPPGSESREARLEKNLKRLTYEWRSKGMALEEAGEEQAAIAYYAHSADLDRALAPDARPSPSSEKQRGDKT